MPFSYSHCVLRMAASEATPTVQGKTAVLRATSTTLRTISRQLVKSTRYSSSEQHHFSRSYFRLHTVSSCRHWSSKLTPLLKALKPCLMNAMLVRSYKPKDMYLVKGLCCSMLVYIALPDIMPHFNFSLNTQAQVATCYV